jgi:hypothetical protein
MVADHATDCGASQAMTTGDMTADAANDRAFQAAGVCRAAGRCERDGEGQGKGIFLHRNSSWNVPDGRIRL